MNRTALLIISSITICITVVIGLLASESLRLDESQTLWAISRPLPSLLTYIAQDVHTPLYFVLAHVWLQLTGVSVLGLRLLSLLFYTLTVGVLYRLVAQNSTRRHALAASMLFGLSPFVVWYSLEGRMYTLLALLATLSHYYFLQTISSLGKRHRLAWGITLVLGLYTHYFFTLVIASQLMFGWYRLGLLLFRQKVFTATSPRFLLREVVASSLRLLTPILIAGILFMPWVVFVYLQGSAATTQPLLLKPTGVNLIETFTLFLFGIQSPSMQSLLIALWPLAGIVLFLLFTNARSIELKRIDYFLVATFLPVIALFIISFARPAFLARFLIFITPTLFTLLSLAFLRQHNRFRRKQLIVVCVVIAGFLVSQATSLANPAREDYQTVSQFLNTHASLHDLVLVSVPFTIYPIEFYYSSPARLETIPRWDRYSQGAIPTFALDELMELTYSQAYVYERLFVILSYDQGYQNDIIGFLDATLPLEAVHHFSPNLQLRIYSFTLSEEKL